MNYDFSTLHDKDLEDLARDILAKKMNVNFQSFKIGKDKGADLRYATNNNENEIIVQVKHFLGSGISQLKSKLKNEELSKVIGLNPQRYILITSLPLSHKNKDDIKIIFTPYILSTDDILGKDDLNNFLRSNREIEEAHFKLWLSSTTVLNRILKNGIKGRSEFIDSKIKERIKVFVPSKTYKISVDILNSKKFILITGAPGIGKTTLADMLTYQLLANKFELIYITDIREAEDAYIPNKKQVFYFNDFLGAATLDLMSSRNMDSANISFIERIINDKDKRLILTCRTTILNQAKEASEIISNSKIDISEYEVKIEDYGNLEKAKILYNHIYFSNLSDELKKIFFKGQFYWKVIKHSNYNPRLVQFFTDIDRLQKNIDYDKEVLWFLDNPEKIWEKAYSVQLSDNARLFLSTMFSLGGSFVISEEKMIYSFEARIDFEVKNNNYKRKSGIFNKVIHELSGAFIVIIHKVDKSNKQTEYRFFNPSIEDFLYFYFSLKNIDEYFNVLRASIYFEQFKSRIITKQEKESKKIYFNSKNYEKLLKIYTERIPNLISYSGSKELETVICSIRLFKWNDIKDIVIPIMDNLDLKYLGWFDREYLIEILEYIADNNLFEEFSFSLEDLFLKLSEDIPSHYLIDSLSKLISKHEVYSDLIENNKNNETEYYQEFQGNIDKCWARDLNHFILTTYKIKEIVDMEELIEIINKRKEEAIKLNKLLKIDYSLAIESYDFDYEKQIIDNLSKQAEKEVQINIIKNNESSGNETLEINRLFNSEGNDEWDDLPF